MKRIWICSIAVCLLGAAAPPPVPAHHTEPYDFRTFGRERTDAELGTVLVPERHAQPLGKTIQIAYVRFKSTAAHPGAPIVYLGGGYGNGITAARTIRFRFFNELRAVSDVIVLDQRGAGLSKPDLTCGDQYSYPLDRPAVPNEMLAAFERAASACVARLRSAGIDVNAYNVNESADDVESLRLALGAPKIDLLAISYGTTLALNFLKRHPASVHRAVLAGVEGLDDTYKLPGQLTEAFSRLGVLAAADANVRAAIPNLNDAFATVLAHLQAHPETATIVHPKTKDPVKVTVGAFDLQYDTVYSAGDRYTLLRTPAALVRMLHGDYRPLAEHAFALRSSALDSALRLTLDCASGESAARAGDIAAQSGTVLGEAANFPFPDVCSVIGNPDLGATFRAPVRSNVPALFISGTLDGKTPPGNAARIATGFSHATKLIIDGAGHGDDLFSSTAAVTETILAFLQSKPVHDTTIKLPAPQFLMPQ